MAGASYLKFQGPATERGSSGTFSAIGAKYPPKCFHNPNQHGCWPNFVSEDPDNDADDD
jgi:hypothetical protein